MSKKNVHLGCLKITEKVSFNIASKASYDNILSGQKLIKIAKNSQFLGGFETLTLAVKQCYLTRQLENDKNCRKMPKFKCHNSSYFLGDQFQIFKQCDAEKLLFR